MGLDGQWRYLKSQPGFRKAPMRVLSRLLRWRLITALGRTTVVRLPARELVLQLLPEWHGSAKLIFTFRDDFEPDLATLESFLPSGAVMVDVGANYGIYSLAASRLVGGSGSVFAFEPARSTFSLLERNIALNRM